MLVLGGDEGSEFVITHPDGTEVRVIINLVKRTGRVALAFHAPRGVVIDRRSVHDAKLQAKKELSDAEGKVQEVCPGCKFKKTSCLCHLATSR